MAISRRISSLGAETTSWSGYLWKVRTCSKNTDKAVCLCLTSGSLQHFGQGPCDHPESCDPLALCASTPVLRLSGTVALPKVFMSEGKFEKVHLRNITIPIACEGVDLSLGKQLTLVLVSLFELRFL